MQTRDDRLAAALQKAGMPPIPDEFSVVPSHQKIPRAILEEIDAFVQVFEHVTTRRAWQEIVTTVAPEIARHKRPEVCFFSAWDFHLPPGKPDSWQLIEFNDNGSGFLFAGLINRVFYELCGLEQDEAIVPPPESSVLADHVTSIVESEAKKFFGEWPPGLFLIVDDTESLRRGKFRQELFLLRDHFRGKGWRTEIGSPAETSWDGGQLRWQGQTVSFVVNRSTDFLWQAEIFSEMSAAYREGRVYVAPNPFTYATRSDKRLLEFLSLPHWDEKLGIQPGERAVLSVHVPETYLLHEDNVEDIARRKEEFCFKPIHGFAGRGLLASSQVGRSRLRRLLKKGQGYVAQKKVLKSFLMTQAEESSGLWTDLRVWAYRGKRFLLSGRASCRPDLLDLSPPGGWLPTYARR